MEGSDDGEAGKMDPWFHSRNGCKPSGFLWMSGLLIPLKKPGIQATSDLCDEPPSTKDRPVRMHETGSHQTVRTCRTLRLAAVLLQRWRGARRS